METMMTAQAMAPASYFYYSPDPHAESRQLHGHFLPQVMPPLHMLPVVPTLPSTPIYSRPGSSCSQHVVHSNSKPFTSIPSQSLTPLASPRPMAHHRPSIMLETTEMDAYYPSTPPLSSSGSAISSPGSCDMLQTPLNPMFSGLDGVECKPEIVEADGRVENFPNVEWVQSCASPPMTPVYLQSQVPQPTEIVPFESSNSDFISSTASCPSLSPSPAPNSQLSVSDVDFCDPRNLTVGSVNSTFAPEYAALSTLSAEDDEDHKFVLRGELFVKTEPVAVSPNSSFEFTAESDVSRGLPSFDDLSDIESEDDFVNGLVNLGEPGVAAPQSNRSRASSDAASLGHSSYTCEDDLEYFDTSLLTVDGLPSPPESCYGSDAHHEKRQKISSTKAAGKPVMNVAADSQSAETNQQGSVSHDDEQNNSGDSGEENSTPNPNASAPAPTNRRGRKQSLTEDPTKTFVCDLCHRRFRRQEHLKRHYRSLHTQDKPFECHECGKKFSRSDNLSQHARTHGAGAIVMNLIDEPMDMLSAAHHHAQMHSAYAAAMAAGAPQHHHPMAATGPMMGPTGGEDYRSLGKVLFQVAADMPGSASELSSDEGSDSGKKRKRPE